MAGDPFGLACRRLPSAQASLDLMRQRLHAHAEAVEAGHGVSIDPGLLTDSKAVVMDAGLLAVFRGAMRDLALDPYEMPSGAGHDAAVFADAGIPTLMLFVRSQNGSHNPACWLPASNG